MKREEKKTNVFVGCLFGSIQTNQMHSFPSFIWYDFAGSIRVLHLDSSGAQALRQANG